VVRLLREHGFTIQKDPNHSPKIQNAGSVASNKSEHKVTCQTCKKFKGRPCELKYVLPLPSNAVIANESEKTHEASLAALRLHLPHLHQNLR
jgi:hypothetical protein